MGALRRDISHHAVEADHRQDERGAGEDTEHDHTEPPVIERCGNDLLDRLELRRHLRIQGACFAPHRVSQDRGVAPRAHDDGEFRRRRGSLEVISVNGRPRLAIETVVTDVADDSDDGQQTQIAVHVSIFDLFADRILVRPIALRQ